MSPGGDATLGGTSSAVPADLRAYARAALEIDEHIHQLAVRLGRVLEAYRATKPEFGDPIPRIEDDLERYAQFCREVDLGVAQTADAFEQAGALPHGAFGPPVPVGQRVVVSDGLLAQAVWAAGAPPPLPPPTPKAKPKEHEGGGGGLFGGLLHAVEHPMDTLGDAASAVELAGSDSLGAAEHAGSDALHNVEDAGAALVHDIEHPSDDLAAAASGLEKAAGGVRDFIDYTVDEGTQAENREFGLVGDVVSAVEHPEETATTLGHLGDRALQGLEALGGRVLHDIEYPTDALGDAEHAQEEFLTGFAAGMKDMAQAAILLARAVPGTPLWAASMAIDPQGTMKLQGQFARGLVQMAANPGEVLGNMLDLKDLEAGDFARWSGHLTPDVLATLLTMGAGGAAAGGGEGMAAAAEEATSEEGAKDIVEGAATASADHAAEGARGAGATLGTPSIPLAKGPIARLLASPAPEDGESVWREISTTDGELVGIR